MGTFVVKQRKNGEFYFNLKAENGVILLSSEGYYTKSACLNAIESLKINAQSDSNFDKISSNDNYYFNIKARNGQIIGTSELYSDRSGRDRGIQSVKHNLEDVKISDQSI